MGRGRRVPLRAAAPWALALSALGRCAGDVQMLPVTLTRKGCSTFLAPLPYSASPQQQGRSEPTSSRGAPSYSFAHSPGWARRSGRVSASASSSSSSRLCRKHAHFQPDARLWLPARRKETTLTGRETFLRGGGDSAGGLSDGSNDRAKTRLPATAVVGTMAGPAAEAAEGASWADIVKPDRDERAYRYLELPNGLAVVLVSDPHTETAAASMFIRCGHMQDPDELAGMAHFHEHMLFLGTEKYPQEGDFENFLTQHGGSSNAYTATESTNYYFDVEASKLQGATDRFAQFFQTPLFTESSLERELQAVDSEHSNNKNDDTWRLFQILKATANPAHAFSKFGSGNYETLKPRPQEGIDTRESLIKFHEKYYSADAMKLSLLGKEDLDTLETWVREAFSGVRNTSPPAIPDYGPAPAFGESELGRRVTVIPLKESRRLALSWPLPPRSVHKRSKPTIYASHLLGYEGEGGLHALLHGRGWVTALSAGSMVSGIDFQLFRLSMSLTEEGERHEDEIIELCYRFIALLREEPPQKRIQDDLDAMGKIRFRFLEKSNPASAVQNIATVLGEDETEPAEVLRDSFTIPEWDPAAITDVLDRLTPRNCQILRVSKKLEGEAERDGPNAGWQRERWYGTPYKVECLPEALLQRLETLPAREEGFPVFSLPGANPFIPTEFGLRADDVKEKAQQQQAAPGVSAAATPAESVDAVRSLLPANIPALALETVPRQDWSRLVPPSLVVAGDAEEEEEGGEEANAAVDVWHKMDRSYRVPRSAIVAKLWTPEPYGSPEAACLSRMFVRLLKEDLKSWAYDAGLADLRYSLEMTTHGLQLSVGGFSSKVALLLSKILGHIGELLDEYRDLGALIESGGGAAQGNGDGGLTVRQRLLQQRFETARQHFIRSYRNAAKDQPYETAGYYVRQVTEAETWHIKEYERALQDAEACTPAAMTRHLDVLLGQLHVDVLAHGNVAREEAVALAPAIAGALSHPKPLPKVELPTRHAQRLPGGRGEGAVVVVELEAEVEEEKNSAVQVYLQVGRGEANLDLASALEFINTVGYTSAFQQLRTQEQLGYIVYTQLERGPAGRVTPVDQETGEGMHPGGPIAWSVVVQSPDKTPAELDERIEAWIAGFRNELEAMSDEVFESTVASMSSSVLRRERSMREEAGIFFGAIAGRTHDFYRRYRKAESYRRLTKEAVLAAYDASLAPGAPGRRKLSVRVAARRHARENGGSTGERGEGDDSAIVLRSLEDIREFKARTPIYD